MRHTSALHKTGGADLGQNYTGTVQTKNHASLACKKIRHKICGLVSLRLIKKKCSVSLNLCTLYTSGENTPEIFVHLNYCARVACTMGSSVLGHMTQQMAHECEGPLRRISAVCSFHGPAVASSKSLFTRPDSCPPGSFAFRCEIMTAHAVVAVEINLPQFRTSASMILGVTQWKLALRAT